MKLPVQKERNVWKEIHSGQRKTQNTGSHALHAGVLGWCLIPHCLPSIITEYWTETRCLTSGEKQLDRPESAWWKFRNDISYIDFRNCVFLKAWALMSFNISCSVSLKWTQKEWTQVPSNHHLKTPMSIFSSSLISSLLSMFLKVT